MADENGCQGDEKALLKPLPINISSVYIIPLQALVVDFGILNINQPFSLQWDF